MNAAALCDWPCKHPGGQGGRDQGLAGCDVLGNPLGDLGPPRQLPELKRTFAPAKPPTHSQIKLACTRGDIAQMNRGIVKAVAHHRPQESRLWIGRFAQ